MKLSEVITKLQAIQKGFGDTDPDCDGTVENVDHLPFEIDEIVILTPNHTDQLGLEELSVCIRIAYYPD